MITRSELEKLSRSEASKRLALYRKDYNTWKDKRNAFHMKSFVIGALYAFDLIEQLKNQKGAS